MNQNPQCPKNIDDIMFYLFSSEKRSEKIYSPEERAYWNNQEKIKRMVFKE